MGNLIDLEEKDKLSKIDKIENIPIFSIRPNPYQPRKHFDKVSLEELAQSIKIHGIIQPIAVRYNGTSYELVAGERRLKAAKLIGLTHVPAVIMEMTDRESAHIALIENIQRENLNFLEEAEGYMVLLNDYGMTQENLANELGKSQSTIANKLRLLKLPPMVKNIILEKGLTERHARALLRLPSESLQLKCLAKIVTKCLNVKQTDEMVKGVLEGILKRGVKKNPGQKEKRYVKDIRLFTNTVKQAVDIMQKAGVPAKYVTNMKDDKVEIVIEIPTA